MIVKMIQDLRKTMEKMWEIFTKDLEELKKKQRETNNRLEGINSRITEAEEQGDRRQGGQNGGNHCCKTEHRKKNEKNEDTQRDLWENIKSTNIFIINIPEGEEREKGPEKIFEEILAENFPYMGKKTVNQVQEAQRVPSRINPRRNPLRHTVIKLTKIKDKDKLSKSTREKWQTTSKGTPIRLSAEFSTGTIQARREWHDIFNAMKEKDLQPRVISKSLIQIWHRNKKLYRQAKVKKIQPHQTSFTTNAKELL